MSTETDEQPISDQKSWRDHFAYCTRLLVYTKPIQGINAGTIPRVSESPSDMRLIDCPGLCYQ